MTAPLIFFPERPEWDVQVMRLAAQATYGGSDHFECLATVEQIKADGETEESWRRRWSALAEELTSESGRDGHLSPATIGQRAGRASSYFRTSEFFAPFESETRKMLFDAARNAFRRAIPALPIEVSITAVRDGDVEYDGYVFRGAGASESRPGPGVVFLGGADSYAEELFFFGGAALAERGITVIVADTPGRGSTLRHKNVVSRPDYEVPAGRVLDSLEALEYVDPDRMGVVGVSLGGYYAPRLAAVDDRVRACVCWCACYDVLEDIYLFCEPLQAQLRWIVGASSDEEAREKLAPFTLADVADQISCPILISHGEADTIIAARSAVSLYEAVAATDKVLKLWPSGGRGGDHCNYDAWSETVPLMFDWLAARLGADSR
jgi:dipeptidyl aminopeptidase/acylaminoacyl peptidase